MSPPLKKFFSFQEGTGPRVLSAYVELIFDNTDNRIPVSFFFLPSHIACLMWLNCNLRQFNFETTLAGQWLSPRQAGLCGVAAGSAGAYMWLHILALLCFVLLIFADHCYSWPVISTGFCSHFSHSWIGKYSTELFQCDGAGWLTLAWLLWLLPRQCSSFALNIGRSTFKAPTPKLILLMSLSYCKTLCNYPISANE